jgi:hypothetical protein
MEILLLLLLSATLGVHCHDQHSQRSQLFRVTYDRQAKSHCQIP